jgi:hypothetical protein
MKAHKLTNKHTFTRWHDKMLQVYLHDVYATCELLKERLPKKYHKEIKKVFFACYNPSHDKKRRDLPQMRLDP